MNDSKIVFLFDKKLDFENTESIILPAEAFSASKWSIPSFQNRKEELNRTKSLLNNYDLTEWSQHTKFRDPSSFILRSLKKKFRAELVTQAWCKFYECLCNFFLIPKEAISERQLSSVHLCEAPGAFISALNHYLVSQNFNLPWKWLANSLNPDFEGNSPHEMVTDDRLLGHTYENWFFGADLTGDVCRYHNYKNLLEKIPEKVWLVTADGSVDCTADPGNQERRVEFLHYCEAFTALSILRKGGSFVLKMFTFFEDSSICLLYLLVGSFGGVSVFKPSSSKSGNSEVYVVCVGFKGFEILENLWPTLITPFRMGHFDQKSMFGKSDLSRDFLNQLQKISDFFMKLQVETINENIFHFRRKVHLEKINRMKVYVASKYMKRYRLEKIEESRRLVGNLEVGAFPNHLREFNFVNRSVKIEVRSLIPSGDFLEVKFGAKIPQVRSSRFCTSENLSKYQSLKRSKCHLYETIEQCISRSTTVINFETLSFSNHNDLQRFIFYKLFNSNKNNLVFIKFPFVTNFFVGLMFLVISCYDYLYFYESGFLLLHDLTGDSLKRLKLIFSKIDNIFQTDNNCDICQLVSPKLFYNSEFFEFVWNYNRTVFEFLK